MGKREQIEAFHLKILDKCSELKKNKNIYFQNPGESEWKWCLSAPLWLKKLDKQSAQELKNLLAGATDKDFVYNFWLSAGVVVDSNSGKFNPSEALDIWDWKSNAINSGLIQGLDKLIGDSPTPNICSTCRSYIQKLETDWKDWEEVEKAKKDFARCPKDGDCRIIQSGPDDGSWDGCPKCQKHLRLIGWCRDLKSGEREVIQRIRETCDCQGDELIKCTNCNKKAKEAIKYEHKSYCSDCKQQLEDEGKAPWKDDKKEKLGKDYSSLTLHQKERRETAHDNWEQKKTTNYNQMKCCRYCPEKFAYDKTLEFLPAKTKAEQELATHEVSCDKKNDQKEQQRLKQEEWDRQRKVKGSRFYICKKCWGKVCLDNKIANFRDACKQALADLKYHEKNECSAVVKKGEKLLTMIPICFSPNQGGNKHAPLSYADGIDINKQEMEQDNETEVIYQGTFEEKKPFNYTPWLIGGGIAIILVIISIIIIRKKKK